MSNKAEFQRGSSLAVREKEGVIRGERPCSDFGKARKGLGVLSPPKVRRYL